MAVDDFTGGAMQGEKPIILHVGGGAPHARALTRALLQHGMHVWEATTEEAALNLVDQGPDLIIVDLALSDGRGLSLCERLAADPSSAMLPLVLLTPERSVLDEVSLREHTGAELCLRRPVSGRELALLTGEVLKRRQVERALRQTEQRYQRLVQSIQEICRIAAGSSTLLRKRFDLAVLAEQAAGICRSVLDGVRQRLVLMALNAPLWIVGDGPRLQAALCLLIEHAAARSAMGAQVWMMVDSEGAHAVVRIRDTGPEITPGKLQRMFDPPQIDSFHPDSGPSGCAGGSGAFKEGPCQSDGDGFGSGLFMVRNVAQLHGGEVRSVSAPHGQGCEIELRLPLAAEFDPDEKNEGSRTHRACQVLVVDDNLNVRSMLSDLLTRWGYQVLTAPDGPTALEVAEKTAPDLVLLDIGMPGMSGYEVAESLRNRPKLGRVRIVAITGLGQREDKARAMISGFDSHVTKPVEPRALRRVLTSVLA